MRINNAIQKKESIRFLWSHSWRMLLRDWRGGELNILAAGLLIAITSITAVGFFTDRIERGLSEQSAELMGADLIITSSRENVSDHIKSARAAGLAIATTVQFRSVLLANNQPQLIEVKAVSANYPLRGVLRISDQPFSDDQATTAIPARGDLWIDYRLLQLLDLQLGDSVSLGHTTFTLRKILRHEPDRAGDMFSVAPRVLFNREDLEQTGLVTQGSLVKYRVLMAGEREHIEKFRNKLALDLRQGEQILGVDEGRPELNAALQRAQQFLGLAALISVLLAGVAVATVSHRFSRRHLITSAMLRCLGATQRTIIQLFILEMLWLALLASTIACLLGLATQLVITELLDQLVMSTLPPPSFKAVLLGYGTGIVMLIGFALPPLTALKQVPPLRVLRSDILTPAANTWLLYLSVAVSMSFLIYWQIGDLKLVFSVLGGIVITVILLALAAYLLILFISRQRNRIGLSWRFGLANIARRPASSIIQIVAFGVGIMVMLLLVVVRSDILDDWQNSLPENAPNHFIINVQSDQVDGITQYLTKRGVANTRLYPMVRARLVRVNDKTVDTSDYETERAKHMITREFNLSGAEHMQVDNRLQSGYWWNSDQFNAPLLSLESKLAKTLNLKLGDKLGFDVNGRMIDLTISSLRNVDWDTFNINFFTVVPPGILKDNPANWVTSVYLDSQQQQQLGELVRAFPNVTVIDVNAIMQRVRHVMQRISLAIEFILLFTILAGLAVLYAAIQSSQDERRFESAVLRTLGASKKTLLRGLITEFALLGALAGLLAGVAATALAWILAEYVFKFSYQPDVIIALAGMMTGVVIVVLAGLLGTRQVLTQAPLLSLRQ